MFIIEFIPGSFSEDRITIVLERTTLRMQQPGSDSKLVDNPQTLSEAQQEEAQQETLQISNTES